MLKYMRLPRTTIRALRKFVAEPTFSNLADIYFDECWSGRGCADCPFFTGEYAAIWCPPSNKNKTIREWHRKLECTGETLSQVTLRMAEALAKAEEGSENGG